MPFNLYIIYFLFFLFIFFAYKYFSTKKFLYKQQEDIKVWRDKEIKTIREEEAKAALDRFERWREQELFLVRKQELEIARMEMEVKFNEWKNKYTHEIRQDAIQKSKAVTFGKVTEHFIPYLSDFVYNPKDARFLGSPVDFVVFDGLSEGEIKSVVFIEVKTGASSLTSRERKIRDAVNAGRIEWAEIRHL